MRIFSGGSNRTDTTRARKEYTIAHGANTHRQTTDGVSLATAS